LLIKTVFWIITFLLIWCPVFQKLHPLKTLIQHRSLGFPPGVWFLRLVIIISRNETSSFLQNIQVFEATVVTIVARSGATKWIIKLNKTNQMHICLKIIKILLHSTLLYMFRTLLCPSSGAFHHCTCSLWLPCGVVLVAALFNNRTGLEDATNTTPHGNQRLNVQWWKAPDDGHNSVRNM
jgi:hypothetical protein